MPASSRPSSLLLSLLLLGVAGCPDTEGKFDDFAERWQKANPGFDGAPPDAAACAAPPNPGELDGSYVFALSAVIQPETPIVLATDATNGTDGLRLSFQPLSAADRRTPIGQPITVGPFPLSADGTLHAELPPLVVPGEANPITGSEIEASVTLDARFCGATDFQCGTVTGSVTRPIPLDLTGPSGPSTFTMERVQGGAFPEQPFLSCSRNRAAPLP